MRRCCVGKYLCKGSVEFWGGFVVAGVGEGRGGVGVAI